MNRHAFRKKEGYLFVKQPVKGSFGKGSWKKKWVAVRQNKSSSGKSVLLELYIERDAYHKPVISLLLEGVDSITRTLSKIREHAFEIKSGEKTLFGVATESESETYHWMEIFNRLLIESEKEELETLPEIGDDFCKVTIVPNKGSETLGLSGDYYAVTMAMKVSLYDPYTAQMKIQWEMHHLKKVLVTTKCHLRDKEKIMHFVVSNRSQHGKCELVFFSEIAKRLADTIFQTLNGAISVTSRQTRSASMVFEITPKDLKRMMRQVDPDSESVLSLAIDGNEGIKEERSVQPIPEEPDAQKENNGEARKKETDTNFKEKNVLDDVEEEGWVLVQKNEEVIENSDGSTRTNVDDTKVKEDEAVGSSHSEQDDGTRKTDPTSVEKDNVMLVSGNLSEHVVSISQNNSSMEIQVESEEKEVLQGEVHTSPRASTDETSTSVEIATESEDKEILESEVHTSPSASTDETSTSVEIATESEDKEILESEVHTSPSASTDETSTSVEIATESEEKEILESEVHTSPSASTEEISTSVEIDTETAVNIQFSNSKDTQMSEEFAAQTASELAQTSVDIETITENKRESCLDKPNQEQITQNEGEQPVVDNNDESKTLPATTDEVSSTEQITLTLEQNGENEPAPELILQIENKALPATTDEVSSIEQITLTLEQNGVNEPAPELTPQILSPTSTENEQQLQMSSDGAINDITADREIVLVPNFGQSSENVPQKQGSSDETDTTLTDSVPVSEVQEPEIDMEMDKASVTEESNDIVAKDEASGDDASKKPEDVCSGEVTDSKTSGIQQDLNHTLAHDVSTDSGFINDANEDGTVGIGNTNNNNSRESLNCVTEENEEGYMQHVETCISNLAGEESSLDTVKLQQDVLPEFGLPVDVADLEEISVIVYSEESPEVLV